MFSQVGGLPERFDLFGFASAAGDFNHDSFADLAVGALFEDVGTHDDAGAVSALYGSAGGLTATGGRLFTQVGGTAEAGDGFGTQLAGGDFNSNGFADLAAVAPTEDVGTVAQAGAVSILQSAGGGLTTTGGRLFTRTAQGCRVPPRPSPSSAVRRSSSDDLRTGSAADLSRPAASLSGSCPQWFVPSGASPRCSDAAVPAAQAPWPGKWSWKQITREKRLGLLGLRPKGHPWRDAWVQPVTASFLIQPHHAGFGASINREGSSLVDSEGLLAV